MLDWFLNWYAQTLDGKNYFQTLYILLFEYWLWIPVLYLFFKAIFLPSWVISRHHKFAHKQKFILLAIDVPKKNELSIAGMELALTQILGHHFAPNWWEKWIDGQFQLSMSLEIVAIDGFIQLLIRCPISWRN